MNAEDLIIWLGDELDKLSRVSIEDGRKYQAGVELVQTAIKELDQMSLDERRQILDAIYISAKTRTIGNYQILSDDGENSDWVEGILSTLEAHLK